MTPIPSNDWHKSSYSANTEGACVQVAWKKSSYSANSQGDCVEVAVPGPVAVRDSKNPDGGMLTVPRTSWSAFISAVRAW